MAISTPNLYPVVLTAEQRTRLEDMTRNGHAPADAAAAAQDRWPHRGPSGRSLLRPGPPKGGHAGPGPYWPTN